VACEPDETPGRWQVTYRVLNFATSTVVLKDAWVPHGRFRGGGHVALDASIGPGAEFHLTLGVASREEPGTSLENAFLILRTSTCRVFARMRIDFDAQRRPRPVVIVVTAQSLE
jgi:hypothetical protein